MKLFRRFWRALVGRPLPTGSETRLDPAKEANAVYVVCSSAQCVDGGNLVPTMDAKEQEISCFAMADEVSQFSPQLAQLYHGRGLHCQGKGEYDNAIANCTEAIRLDPSLARAYANRGVAYGMKGDHDKAIDDFTEAIRLDPSLAEVHCDRGVTFGMKGDDDNAIADLTQAILLDPHDAGPYYTLRLPYWKRDIGDIDRSYACKNRGLVYRRKGDLDKAISDFTEAIRFNPGNADAYNGRAVAYRMKGQEAKAEEDLARAKRFGFEPK